MILIEMFDLAQHNQIIILIQLIFLKLQIDTLHFFFPMQCLKSCVHHT